MDERVPVTAITLTAAAGVLHVAAALAHRDVSLLLTVAFLAVAAIQLAGGLTAQRWPGATAELVTATNLAAVGAWAVSRTVGLPLVGTGVEPVGLGDVTTVVLQLAAVGSIVLGPRLHLAPLALVAGLGAVALAAPTVGHAHDDAHPHAGDHGSAGTVDVAAVVQLGPGDFEGDTDLTTPGNAEAMRSLMTGAVRPVVITSDGRLLGAGTSDDGAPLTSDGASPHSAAPGGEDDHPHDPGTPTHGH